jgi:hypothetical protein
MSSGAQQRGRVPWQGGVERSGEPGCRGVHPGSTLYVQNAAPLTDRVLERLSKAREKEPDLQLRDDLNIAWITVCWASTGIPERIPYPGPAKPCRNISGFALSSG